VGHESVDTPQAVTVVPHALACSGSPEGLGPWTPCAPAQGLVAKYFATVARVGRTRGEAR
jgi:hypothetical protein